MSDPRYAPIGWDWAAMSLVVGHALTCASCMAVAWLILGVVRRYAVLLRYGREDWVLGGGLCLFVAVIGLSQGLAAALGWADVRDLYMIATLFSGAFSAAYAAVIALYAVPGAKRNVTRFVRHSDERVAAIQSRCQELEARLAGGVRA